MNAVRQVARFCKTAKKYKLGRLILLGLWRFPPSIPVSGKISIVKLMNFLRINQLPITADCVCGN